MVRHTKLRQLSKFQLKGLILHQRLMQQTMTRLSKANLQDLRQHCYSDDDHGDNISKFKLTDVTSKDKVLSSEIRPKQ